MSEIPFVTSNSVVHAQVPAGILTVSPSDADPTAAPTEARLQLAATTVAASAGRLTAPQTKQLSINIE